MLWLDSFAKLSMKSFFNNIEIQFYKFGVFMQRRVCKIQMTINIIKFEIEKEVVNIVVRMSTIVFYKHGLLFLSIMLLKMNEK